MSAKVKVRYLLMFLVPHMLIYFVLQRLFSANEYNFLTPADELIPFISEFIWVYHSLIPVICFTAIILLKSRKSFFTCYYACLLAAVSLTAFYILFPSFYPREELIGNSTSLWLVELTRVFDHANNTFPSSHVTFSWLMFLSAKCSELAKKWRPLGVLYFIWASLITISTLVLKQHFIVDVVSGIILAHLSFHVAMKFVGYFHYEK